MACPRKCVSLCALDIHILSVVKAEVPLYLLTTPILNEFPQRQYESRMICIHLDKLSCNDMVSKRQLIRHPGIVTNGQEQLVIPQRTDLHSKSRINGVWVNSSPSMVNQISAAITVQKAANFKAKLYFSCKMLVPIEAASPFWWKCGSCQIPFQCPLLQNSVNLAITW